MIGPVQDLEQKLAWDLFVRRKPMAQPERQVDRSWVIYGGLSDLALVVLRMEGR
jgi:hypothetical protein